MMELAKAFREFADLFEDINSRSERLEISSVKPNVAISNDDERISLGIGVEVPFFDERTVDGKTDIQLEDVRFTDNGSLQIELLALRGYTHEDALPDENPDSGSDGTVDRHSEEVLKREPDEVIEDQPSGGGQSADGEQDEETGLVSEQQADSSQLYRNPDRLREVYEEYDTFGEMTDALGVDVTPQTVRRHMIRHNIHTPLSSTGSEAVARLIDADPDEFFSDIRG